MNCVPEQKLSMEELKRLNPSRCSLPQMRTTLPPAPIQQDWRELLIEQLTLPNKLEPVSVIGFGWPDEGKELNSRWDTAMVHYEKW